MFEEQSKETQDCVKAFAQDPKGFLVLFGVNGCGKSFAAWQIYNSNTAFKLPAYDNDAAIFYNQADLNMKFSVAANQCTTHFLLDELKNTRVLIFDDLGTRTPSEPFMDFIYALFDYRYNHRDTKGTVITTNLNALDIRNKFGDQIVSRILSSKNLLFTGGDSRFRK